MYKLNQVCYYLGLVAVTKRNHKQKIEKIEISCPSLSYIDSMDRNKVFMMLKEYS